MQQELTDESDFALEFAVLREWEDIQRRLIFCICGTFPLPSLSWREVIDSQITLCTKGRAFLYWDPFETRNTRGCDRFCEVRFKHIRYGFLGFAPGYLASRSFPDIPQHFAHLCALILAFIEHQELVRHQLDALPAHFPTHPSERLTRREREVLIGLIRGKSDTEIALFLGIEPSTVHTHRGRLYRRLGVHSAQEATLCCFTYRLVNWLERTV